MRPALYFPFSRCLDDQTLKQALLLYDRLLFVDPADSGERDALYHGEVHTVTPGGVSLSAQWQQVARNYRLLEQENLIELVVPSDVLPDDAALDLLEDGLHLDLVRNRGRRMRGVPDTWSILDSRLPAGALQRLGRWLADAKHDYDQH